ncbi:MAG TPA: hypothetical protein VM686_34920 [Polyangiaceae bacterium]|nr:hypothetical protein [Polyangiaceae bacterium]
MNRSRASQLPALVAVLVSLSTFSACGEDSPDDEGSAGNTPAAGNGGRGGSSGSGGSKSGRGGDASAGSPDANGGAPGGEAGEGAGATSSGQAGSGTGSGGEPPVGGEAGAGGIQVPGPAPGGGSVYAVECSGETAMCGTEYAHCLGIGLPDNMTGFSCSNHCDTVADCSDEPTGAEAQPGCVQFTMEKRCMLVCQQGDTEYACPDGMSCYVYQGSPIGYCLWM